MKTSNEEWCKYYSAHIMYRRSYILLELVVVGSVVILQCIAKIFRQKW